MIIDYNYRFTNIHENIAFDPERLYLLENTDETDTQLTGFFNRWHGGIASIKEVLRQAKADDKKVRVIGGTWSLSDVQETTDYLINANYLNCIQAGLQTNAVETGVDNKYYCISQCGASVMEVNEELRKKMMALSTSGASDGQSIAGAISTGTHGAAFKFGSMPDYVEGMHIIVSEDVHYWVEGDSRIVSRAFIDYYVPGAIRINNDDVFNAAIVSFGSFGVIHAVMLKVEPLYNLCHYQNYKPWSSVRQCIDNLENIHVLEIPEITSENLYCFTVVTNPYNTGRMVINAMLKKDYTLATPPVVNPAFSPSEDALEFIGKIGGLSPKIIPAIMSAMDQTIQNQYPVRNGLTNIPGWMYRGGAVIERGRALSVELGIDARQTQKVADIIFNELIYRYPFPGLISFRYIKQTKATLGFAKYPLTCAVEFPAVHSSATNTFFEKLYKALDDAGIEYTFHWGQCNNLNSVNVLEKYGNEAVQSWLNARYQILKTHEQQKMFSNKFMQRLGLDILSTEDHSPLIT